MKQWRGAREIRTTAILAGGRSRRFGSNKALAPWGEGRVIDSVVQAARLTSQAVFICANDPAPYLDLGLPVIPDGSPGAGPLAGLETALRYAAGQRVLLLGCDMPLVCPEALEWMWRIPSWAPVVIPRGPGGLEPLHAIYHTSLGRLASIRLAQSRLRIRELLEDIPYFEIRPAELERFCPGLLCLASANTPEQLIALERHRIHAGAAPSRS